MSTSYYLFKSPVKKISLSAAVPNPDKENIEIRFYLLEFEKGRATLNLTATPQEHDSFLDLFVDRNHVVAHAYYGGSLHGACLDVYENLPEDTQVISDTLHMCRIKQLFESRKVIKKYA